MIEIVQGDILESGKNIICHQVNCRGVMGSGLAQQVRKKFPVVYEEYLETIKNTPNPLGHTIFSEVGEDLFVASLFGQDGYGRDKQYTDYDALRKGLKTVCWFAKLKNYSVAIPFGIGCGLGGGDWDVVYKIICDVFSDTNVDVAIYRMV